MDYNKKKCIEHFEFFNIHKILTQTFFHLTRRILCNALKPRNRHFQNEKNGHFFTFPLRFYWIDLNVFHGDSMSGLVLGPILYYV